MIIRRRYSTMFKTSVHCLLFLFIFENLVVHGLVNEGDGEQKPNLLVVDTLHNKSLPKEIELSTALSNHDANVTDTTKSVKLSIKSNDATHSTKNNKTSELKFKIQNITTTTVAYFDKKDENKTGEDNDHNTEKEGNSSKLNVVTTIIGITKPISESSNVNENGIESTINTEETTTVSDLVTNNSNEKTLIFVTSSPETSSTSNSVPSISSSTSMKSSSTEEIVPIDDPQQSETPVDGKEDKKMSSGIIALVMAIVFAIVVIIVYVGLLVWRRYLEYRYGNRELLVNDLEFDTNDLRHFEL